MLARPLAAACLVLLSTACLADPSLEEADAPVVVGNGALLNGPLLNGRTLNGSWFNGPYANGRRWNGRRWNGIALEGSVMTVALEGGGRAALGVGDVIQATTGEGLSATLEVTSARTVVANVVRDFWSGDRQNAITYYRLRATAAGQSFDYCPNGAEAVALAGSWDFGSGAKRSDASAITFACLGYALGKCVEAGYWAWGRWVQSSDYTEYAGRTVSVAENVALEAAHQACVRAIRADYCGDGTSHTWDGVLIDIFDELGVQGADGEGGWMGEADWGPDGAVCAARERIWDPDFTPCNFSPSCASGSMAGGALVRTRIR